MHKLLHLFLAFITICIGKPAYSFNPEKCKENFFKPQYQHDKGLPSKFVSSTSNSTILLSDATTLPLAMSESMSSTGFCGAMNPSEKEKFEFFSRNFEPLKIEIAQGNGEFLNSFVALFKCDDDAKIKNKLKNDFAVIYSETVDVEHSFRKVQNSVRMAGAQTCSNAVRN